jgi:hypothetical protein
MTAQQPDPDHPQMRVTPLPQFSTTRQQHANRQAFCVSVLESH